jgi:cobalt-zinc-cadmium resistance protein CzcA
VTSRRLPDARTILGGPFATAFVVIVGGGDGRVSSPVHLPDAFPDTTPVRAGEPVALALFRWRSSGRLRDRSNGRLGPPGLTESVGLKFGFSQVTVTFEDRIVSYLARQVVMERIQTASCLRESLALRSAPSRRDSETFLPHHGRWQDVADLRTVRTGSSSHSFARAHVAEVNTWGRRASDPCRRRSGGSSGSISARGPCGGTRQNNANVGGGTLDAAGESSLVQGIGIATGPATSRRSWSPHGRRSHPRA